MKRFALIAVVLGCAPQQHAQQVSSTFVVSAGSIRHFPMLFSDGDRLFASFSQHKDEVVFPATDGIATIGGSEFSAENFYATSVVRVGNSLIATNYATQRMDLLTERSFSWVSENAGLTWKPRLGVVNLNQPQLLRDAGWGGFLFHRTMLAMSDGSIAGTMYGNYSSDSKYRTIWVRSNDAGLTWDIVSTVAVGDVGEEGYGEPVSIICPDHSILVVMRTGNSPLRQVRSLDDGKNWSQPIIIPGLSDKQTIGWDPDLTVIGNRTYLSYGRPGQVEILFSDDNGDKWMPLVSVGIPTSSGYTGIRQSGQNELLLVTDSENETKIIGMNFSASPR